MSSKNRNIPIKMVRILRQEKSAPTNYSQDVTVGMVKDDDQDSVYLRIAVKKESIVIEELDNFQWLDDSCANGVVALQSSSMKVIILYDTKDRPSCDLIAEMDAYYHSEKKEEPAASTGSTGEIESRLSSLVKSIGNGSISNAEQAARYLAKNRAKVQFHLSSLEDVDDKKSEKKTSGSNADASADVLELKLQVECYLNQEPLVETIYVRSGTKLEDLKDQIEQEANIKFKDQYWFAAGEYLISDDYEFGSGKSVIASRSTAASSRKQQSVETTVKSGDTLILVIAQMPPVH